MKKIGIIIILILFFNVNASVINSENVYSCNGKFYGSPEGSSKFYEVVEKEGEWIKNSDEVSLPNCFLKPVNKKEVVTFSKCVDGDTAKFIINGKEETVRFLAIDTPEVSGSNKVPLGKDASSFTCNKLKNAKKIVLEYDQNSNLKDKYGRILAFVFADGKLLEKELIKNGLAKVYYVYGDYNYVDELRKEEEKAKEKQIGIWSNMPDIQENVVDEKEGEYIKFIKKIWEYIIKIFDLLIN